MQTQGASFSAEVLYAIMVAMEAVKVLPDVPFNTCEYTILPFLDLMEIESKNAGNENCFWVSFSINLTTGSFHYQAGGDHGHFKILVILAHERFYSPFGILSFKENDEKTNIFFVTEENFQTEEKEFRIIIKKI